jgi:hypothetical protein
MLLGSMYALARNDEQGDARDAHERSGSRGEGGERFAKHDIARRHPTHMSHICDLHRA